MDSGTAVWLLVVVLTGAVALFLTLRLLGDIRPHDYFAISDIVTGIDFPVGVFGVLYRLAAPTIWGLVAGLLVQDSGAVAGGGVGLVGGFLVVWPPISNPVLLEPRLRKSFSRLLLVYGMFMFSMMSLGLFGGLASSPMTSLLTSDAVSPTAREIVVGVVSGLLGIGLLKSFDLARRKLRQWPN